ncbi:carbohydrate ABC transporter substrate-binding protein (CUT1 family) [Microterricola gilva]|uniref:Carbohydrate ABC transporter substrate-binding protein (CUT1 family) n=1 Tax=Microterricola gilva TaxID=393267 RepID=A0A4Q8ANI9_9MICO|nr:sugar ABC transporter substrate-binding protein [Microterricola gilva]RZU66108.1 carbohydrate ABC transporter substrate-binding protein (CUT1 family) [Microterricola gilva]
METTTTRRWARLGAVVGAGALLVGALSGCSAAATGGDKPVTEDVTLTWWTWSDSTQVLADEITKANPNITFDVVKLENPDAVVTKLQNAVKAGKGAPDLVPVEYQTLPQLTLGDALADVSEYGLGDYEDAFTASTWNAVNVQGKLVALPMDSGPMVMIYNKDLYANAGVAEAPKTWDQFADASAKIHAFDPEAYIANSGDAGFFTSMIWASGGQPFQTEGENVTINLQDEGTKKFATYWGDRLNAGELSGVPTWSDEWSKALTQDKLGTLLMGSWMISGMNDYGTLGKWAVAPIPSWDGQPASAENGGSALAVTEQSEKKDAAAAVLKYLAEGEGRALLNANGFPSTVADLTDPEFLDHPFEAYGGQPANQIGAASAESVVAGWQYLPYQGYANNVFTDSVGKALGSNGDLNEALVEWQDTLVTFGNEQGFSVNK